MGSSEFGSRYSPVYKVTLTFPEVTLRSLEVTFEAPRGLGIAILLLRPFVDVESGAQPGVAAYLPWWAAVRDTGRGSLASRTDGALEFRRQQAGYARREEASAKYLSNAKSSMKYFRMVDYLVTVIYELVIELMNEF